MRTAEIFSVNRGFAAILVLGLIAAVLVLGGMYLLKQNKKSVVQTTVQSSPSPVDKSVNLDSIGANWKTYTNKKFNFSIKYPLDKKVEIDENGKNDSCVGKDSVDFKLYPNNYTRSPNAIEFDGDLWISVGMVDNSGKDPLEFMTMNCPDLRNKASVKNITIDGMTAKKLNYKDVMVEQADIVLTKNGKLYFIHGYSSSLDKINSIFLEVASTFKFTN